MRTFSFVIILIPFLFTGFSRSQQIYFNYRYNLCGTYEPDAWSSSSDILPIEDGYVLAGATVDTLTYWMRRIAIMKLNLNGSVIMLRDFGNDMVDYYKGWPDSLIRKTENQYSLAGAKEYWNPERYAVGYLMTFDSVFDTTWTRSYNLNLDSNPDTNCNFAQMDVCFNNDLIFSGSMNGDRMLLLRTDSLGNMRWYKTFHLDPNTLTTGYSVIQTTDGGFALGGFSYYIGNPESGDPIIIKTDSLGNQEWIKYLGGNFLDNRAMLSLATDGTIVMGSTYGESMSGDDPISFNNLVTLDNEGPILWDKNYGLSYKYNYLFNVRALPNGDIIPTGRRPDDFPHLAGWIIKVNSDGEELWYREYSHLHGPQSMNQLSHVIETADNGYIACGYVNPFPPAGGGGRVDGKCLCIATGAIPAGVQRRPRSQSQCKVPGCTLMTSFFNGNFIHFPASETRKHGRTRCNSSKALYSVSFGVLVAKENQPPMHQGTKMHQYIPPNFIILVRSLTNPRLKT